MEKNKRKNNHNLIRNCLCRDRIQLGDNIRQDVANNRSTHQSGPQRISNNAHFRFPLFPSPLPCSLPATARGPATSAATHWSAVWSAEERLCLRPGPSFRFVRHPPSTRMKAVRDGGSTCRRRYRGCPHHKRRGRHNPRRRCSGPDSRCTVLEQSHRHDGRKKRCGGRRGSGKKIGPVTQIKGWIASFPCNGR